MDDLTCKKCGAKNIESAVFCQECGGKLEHLSSSNHSIKDEIDDKIIFYADEIVDRVKSSSKKRSIKDESDDKIIFYADKIVDRVKKYWKSKETGAKIFIIVVVFCLLSFFIIAGAVAFPKSTELTMDQYYPQIGNNTTYNLKGTTEANAKVYISSSKLNFNVEVNADNSGRFEQTLNIPLDIKEVEVYLVSTAPYKKSSSGTVTILRSVAMQPPTTDNSKNNLDINVKKGIEDFFKDFNAMYNEDGINKGYLINTIQIDKLNKISDTEVDVTVSLKRITSNGDNFDSKWSGPFYLKEGKWIDDGNFVQIYSYNKNTGQKVI